MSPQNLEFVCAHGASRGARPYQEDSIRVWRPDVGSGANKERPVLVVLADGMGGHVSGEVASGTACDQYVKTFVAADKLVDQRLDEALTAANDALGEAIRKNGALNGMGCTLVAGYIDHDGLRWASVGDSSILLFRPPNLYRLNEDHSLGSLLDKQVQAGHISAEQAKSDPRRRTLRSALTGNPLPLKQLHGQPYPLKPGDWLVIASDGLETLSGNDIAKVIADHHVSSPDKLVESLLRAVDDRRQAYQDNTTLSVLGVREQGQDVHSQPTREVVASKQLVEMLEKDVVRIGQVVPADGQPLMELDALPAGRRRMGLVAPIGLTLLAAAAVALWLGWSDLFPGSLSSSPSTAAAKTPQPAGNSLDPPKQTGAVPTGAPSVPANKVTGVGASVPTQGNSGESGPRTPALVTPSTPAESIPAKKTEFSLSGVLITLLIGATSVNLLSTLLKGIGDFQVPSSSSIIFLTDASSNSPTTDNVAFEAP